VRAGGHGCLVRPYDAGQRVQIVDNFAGEMQEPYRVLVVEDDPDQAAQYAAILEGAAMRAAVTCDPRTFFDDLAAFDAEMILMDLYLPGCTGIELTTAPRQRESATGIPIVFLSTEARIDRQLEALRRGGDNFLTNPTRPTGPCSWPRVPAATASRLPPACRRGPPPGGFKSPPCRRDLDDRQPRRGWRRGVFAAARFCA